MIWVVQKWLRAIRICEYIVLNIIVIVESESGGVAQNGQVRVEYANIEVLAHSLQYNESKINFVVSTFSIILFNGISCLLLMIKSTFEEAT